ncbi:contactin-3-like isoform X3 [Dysidea avara]|uniref:contactin-3-like isoform X3 n=1 Tax=Dysidea avara TaxID=196820 RepID=UPI003324DBD8
MSVTLNCEGTGRGSITYQWQTRNIYGGQWSDISNSNNRRLVVRNLQESQQYRCIVFNEAGGTRSNVASVTVLKITTHPQDRLVPVGSSVRLTCTSSVSSNVTFSWTSDGRDVTGQSTSTGDTSILTITSVRSSDDGSYVCTVRSGSLSVMSNTASLTVYEITTHPSSTTVIALQDVTLTCSASVDDVTYSWHRDGSSVPSKSRGQNSNMLIITRATPRDEGIYYCMANKEGISVESSIARVRVDDQLSISITPTNTVAGEQRTVQFTATTSGINKRNFVYQWRRRGSSSLPNKVSGVNGAVLTIPNLVESDEGVYFCTVTNQWDNSVRSDDVTLSVIVGLPLFWRHPRNKFVNNNDKVIFDCFANGSDSLTIKWEKDRRSYTLGVTQVTTHSNGVSSSLTLNRATVADSGKYRCRATNSDKKSVTSNEAELLILPQILTNPDDDTVFIGMSTQLTCNALGINIVYHWMKDGVVVSGANSNMLRITNIEESDEGVYKCVVSNKGGQVESNPATITVYGPPILQELPQQVHVVLGEEFQITCTATNDQDAPTNLMFSWEAPRGAEFNETTTDEDDSLTASSTLHVISVTKSHGGKYACNVRNTRRANVDTSFTLIVEVKSSPPTIFNITQVLINSLQLTWTVPTNPRGSIDYYNVYYYSSDQLVQAANVTNFTGNYTLDNLRPYTEYSVYVTAVRLIETTGRSLEGEKSEIVSARTLAGEPVVQLPGTPVVLDRENSFIINVNNSDSTKFAIELPMITAEKGPYSHLYIVVVNNNVDDEFGSTTTRQVNENVTKIPTKELIEASMSTSSLVYVAAVVNASQYVPGYRMSYILGAGDSTTDPDGHVFYNREVKEGFEYFFRVFSADSTPKNEITFTTDLQKHVRPQWSADSSSDSTDSSVVAIVVLAVLLMVSSVCNVVLLVWVFKQKLSDETKPKSGATKQGSAVPEPVYESVDTSSDLKLEKNPAYSVTAAQGSSEDHHYDVIPASHHAKAK